MQNQKRDETEKPQYRRGHETTDGIYIYRGNNIILHTSGILYPDVERHVAQYVVDALNAYESRVEFPKDS